jgi:hypothetical protein
MKYQLSFLCPAIRVDRWPALYESIAKSFSGTWEIIFITDVKKPVYFRYKENAKFIYSRRSPMQKQQEGLCQAEGEWIVPLSDDQIFIPDALDSAFKKTGHYKTLVIMKYLEGPEFEYPDWHKKERPYNTNYDFMKSESYYMSGTHQSSTYKHIPFNTPILSCCFISKRVLFEVGGWDCQFQTQAIGNVDLAARLMSYGCDYVFYDDIVETCGHMPGVEGDHSALHYAQLNDDEPLLKKIYGGDNCERHIIIPMDNWKLTEEVWKRSLN